MAAGAPSDLVVPTAIASLAAGRPLSLVWANEAGGLTFELGEGSSRRFIKWGDGCAPNTLIGADGRYYRLLWDLSS